MSYQNIPSSIYHISRKSLITVVQPEYGIFARAGASIGSGAALGVALGANQLIGLHNNLNIIINNMQLDATNINSMDYRTMAINPIINPDTNFPQNSIKIIQNNDSTDIDILPNTLNICKIRITFDRTDPLNPNILNWVTHVPGVGAVQPVANLVALDITPLNDEQINASFNQLIPIINEPLSLYTKSMCNLVIIKFKDHYIYLHDIGAIKQSLPVKLKEKFNGAEKIYIVPNLLQISINNGTEIIHFTPHY